MKTSFNNPLPGKQEQVLVPLSKVIHSPPFQQAHILGTGFSTSDAECYNRKKSFSTIKHGQKRMVIHRLQGLLRVIYKYFITFPVVCYVKSEVVIAIYLKAYTTSQFIAFLIIIRCR